MPDVERGHESLAAPHRVVRDAPGRERHVRDADQRSVRRPDAREPERNFLDGPSIPFPLDEVADVGVLHEEHPADEGADDLLGGDPDRERERRDDDCGPAEQVAEAGGPERRDDVARPEQPVDRLLDGLVQTSSSDGMAHRRHDDQSPEEVRHHEHRDEHPQLSNEAGCGRGIQFEAQHPPVRSRCGSPWRGRGRRTDRGSRTRSGRR